MENQHRRIKGYKELTQAQIDGINAVKELGMKVGDLCQDLQNKEVDSRWLAIAKTDLQKGFMSLTRSIAQPDFF